MTTKTILLGLAGAAAMLAAMALSAYLGRAEGMRAGEARAEWWRREAMIHKAEVSFCNEVIGEAAEQAAARRAGNE